MRLPKISMWLPYLGMLLLVACAQQLAQPQTFKQSIAYAEAGLTATYQTIATLKTEGRISAQTRNHLVSQADQVGDALDAARAASQVGNVTQANLSLETARAALIALQAVLRSFGS